MLSKRHSEQEFYFAQSQPRKQPKLDDLNKMDFQEMMNCLAQAHQYFKTERSAIIDLEAPQSSVLFNNAQYLMPVKQEETVVKVEADLDSASTQDGTDKDEIAVKIEEGVNETEDESKLEDQEEETELDDDRYGPKVDTKNLFGILRDRNIKLVLEVIDASKLPQIAPKDSKKLLKGFAKICLDIIMRQEDSIKHQFGKFLLDYIKDKEEYKNYEKCNKNQKWKKMAKDIDLDSTSFYNLMKRYFYDVDPKDWLDIVNKGGVDMVKLRDLHELGGNEDLVDRPFYNWKNNKSRVKLTEFCQLEGFGQGSLLFYKLVRTFMDLDDSCEGGPEKKKDHTSKKLLSAQFKKNFFKNVAKECDKALKKTRIV